MNGKLPATVAVPLRRPAELSVTPPGSIPVSVKVGTGTPDAVTVNDPAVPAVNVVLFALVIVGAWFAANVAVAENVLLPVAEAAQVVDVPVQPPLPLHPMKVNPLLGVSVSVVLKFAAYVWEQVWPGLAAAIQLEI